MAPHKKELIADMIRELSEINLEYLIINKLVAVGLDIGDKTVGVAVSDARMKIASGITTLVRVKDDISRLMTILRPYKVGLIVVGWPVQMNGIPGSQCEKVQKFIDDIVPMIDAPIIKWDERFSTKVVDSVLIEANVSRKKRKKYVDKIAATYILQGVLDYFERRL